MENYKKSEKYLDDMNEACNNMFTFMRGNKLDKLLKTKIIETIIITSQINKISKDYLLLKVCQSVQK